MTSQRIIHDDAPPSINSAIRTDNKSAGSWLKAAMADFYRFITMAFVAIGLPITFSSIFRFPSFQPSIEQIAQLIG